MCAQYSNNARSCQSRRSRSATRNRDPRRLQSTRCSVRATADVGSIWTSPSASTVGTMSVRRGASRSCPLTAICRARLRERWVGSTIGGEGYRRATTGSGRTVLAARPYTLRVPWNS
jgi:hypothetical protein